MRAHPAVALPNRAVPLLLVKLPPPLWLLANPTMKRFSLPGNLSRYCAASVAKIANHRLVHRQASTKLITESAENYASLNALRD